MILKLWISIAEGLQHALRGQQKSASTHGLEIPKFLAVFEVNPVSEAGK